MRKSAVFPIRCGMILAVALASHAAIAEGLRPLARPADLIAAAAAVPGDAGPGGADEAATSAPDAPAAIPPDAVPAVLAAVSMPAADAATPVEATTSHCPPAAQGVHLGPVTCLVLPRFVSLKTDEGNVRRGPSLSHRVDWVFVREDMPLQITAEYGHWRRVVDRDGLGGWVHYSLLSGARTVIVDHDLQPLYARPDPESSQNALLEAGVVARLDACTLDWCRISAGGYRGWAPKTALWGIAADEVRD